MISNLKRYSQLIKKTEELFSNTSGDVHKKSVFIPFKVYTEDYNVSFNMYYNFRVPDSLRAVEDSNGQIIVGLDLNKTPRLSLETPDNKYMLDDKELREHVFNEKLYSLYLWNDNDNPNNRKTLDAISPYSIGEVKNNLKLLDNTDLFIKTKECLKEITTTDFIDLELRDGEFPKLKDRKILPIIMIDLKDGKAKYFWKRYIDSYRKGLDYIDISTYTTLNSNDFRSAKVVADLLIAVNNRKLKCVSNVWIS